MGKTEDVVLRHSQRGMLLLKEYLPDNYIELAVRDILSWQKGNVLLTTGFYVAGFAETDGPSGTVFLALALKKLGFHPVIVTDSFCRGFFELKGIEVEYMEIEEDPDKADAAAQAVLDRYVPVGMISIERCGINTRHDYENMRGISIKEHTAQTDRLFLKALGKIPTIGVGDGGNEIGMGNVQEIIAEKLSLVPCAVRVDDLVIASVSNWGAYGMTAALQLATGESVYPEPEEVISYIADTVAIGSVDGVTHEKKVGVDGYDISVETEILTALQDLLR